MAYNTYLQPNGYPQYPQYPQRQEYRPMMASQPTGLNCIYVTSKAEVDATPTPVDGSTVVFRDIVNDKFYTKAFNMNTGTASVGTYGREADVVAVSPQYVTIEDFNALKEEIDKLKKPTKKEKQNETD